MGKRSLLEPTAASRPSVCMTWSGHKYVNVEMSSVAFTTYIYHLQ